jgi:tryptophan synthase beta chain
VLRVDKSGYYGDYGGRFVPETLMPALMELEAAFNKCWKDRKFRTELDSLLRDYSGRPTPLYHAQNLSSRWGAQVFLKREDLNHTGAHKINNTLGQALLAKYLGKKRIIAETGAGQHNLLRMRMLGAEVIEIDQGTGTLKEATTAAIQDWVTNVRNTHYIIGSTVGPHPFPEIVRKFQSVIGRETKKQIKNQAGRLPDYIVACVGGGSNSIGIFDAFLKDTDVHLIGVESAGEGLSSGKHAATLKKGSPGVLHGSLSYLLQDRDGQILLTETVSAGLDYPGVGPVHSFLKDQQRVKYNTVTDREAVTAFGELCRFEGIIPALESSFALAHARKISRKANRKTIVIVNLSGRGDKDLESISHYEKNRR